MNGNRHFQIPAKRVGELHLSRRAAFGFEHQGRPDQHANASCTRSRHVQPVRAVKKLHASRRIGVAGRRHRIDDDRRFLTLKLIDGSDSASGDALLKLKDLRVVRRDDKDIIQPDCRFLALAINPCSLRTQNLRDKLADFLRLLGARTLISLVSDWDESEAGTTDPSVGSYFLQFQSGARMQPALVEEL